MDDELQEHIRDALRSTRAELRATQRQLRRLGVFVADSLERLDIALDDNAQPKEAQREHHPERDRSTVRPAG